MLDPAEVKLGFDALKTGDATIVWGNYTTSGISTYLLSNGWIMLVFMDCPDWDYVDGFITPYGSYINLWPEDEVEDDNTWDAIRNWDPEDTEDMFYTWKDVSVEWVGYRNRKIV